jgi:hypothetical protein
VFSTANCIELQAPETSLYAHPYAPLEASRAGRAMS